MKKLLAPAVALAIALVTAGGIVAAFYAGSAHADTGGGSAVGSGSGSAIGSAADQLHDPLANPVQAYDDLLAAKKIGWVALAFALALMGAKLAGSLGSKVSFLAFLGQGKAAVVVAGLVSVAAAGYNALITGGSYTAILAAVVLSLAAFWDSASKPPAPAPAK